MVMKYQFYKYFSTDIPSYHHIFYFVHGMYNCTTSEILFRRVLEVKRIHEGQFVNYTLFTDYRVHWLYESANYNNQKY